MPVGRPRAYTVEISDKLCAMLSEGISLRTACKSKGLPCAATVFTWLRTIPEFLEQYEKAKAESADAMADEILDIADNGTNDWMEVHARDDVAYKQNGEAIQRSRLRVDARKWLASKLKPKKYGEKLNLSGQIDHKHTVKVVDLSGNSEDKHK